MEEKATRYRINIDLIAPDGTEDLEREYMDFDMMWYWNGTPTYADNICNEPDGFEVDLNSRIYVNGYRHYEDVYVSYVSCYSTENLVVYDDGFEFLFEDVYSIANSAGVAGVYAEHICIYLEYLSEVEVVFDSNGGEVETSVNDLRNWTTMQLEDDGVYAPYVTQHVTYDAVSDASVLSVGGVWGIWEVVAVEMNFSQLNVAYDISFSYEVLYDYVATQGYAGIAVQILDSAPKAGDNASVAYNNLPTTGGSKGTKTLTFTPTQESYWLAINSGYSEDGQNSCVRYGDWKVSDGGEFKLKHKRVYDVESVYSNPKKQVGVNVYNPLKVSCYGDVSIASEPTSGDTFITLNTTNNSGGVQWHQFAHDADERLELNTTYVVRIEVVECGMEGIWLTFTSPDDVPGQTDMSATGQCNFSIGGVGVYENTFKTKSSYTDVMYNFRSYVGVNNGESKYAKFRIIVYKQEEQKSEPLPTAKREGCVFLGWSKKLTGSEIVDDSTKCTTSYSEYNSKRYSITLYARWGLQADIAYYSQEATDDFELSVFVENGTIFSMDKETLKLGEVSRILLEFNGDADYNAKVGVCAKDASLEELFKIGFCERPSVDSSFGAVSTGINPETGMIDVSVYVCQYYHCAFDANGGEGEVPEDLEWLHGDDVLIPEVPFVDPNGQYLTSGGWAAATDGEALWWGGDTVEKSGALVSDTGTQVTKLYADWYGDVKRFFVYVMTYNGQEYVHSHDGGTVDVTTYREGYRPGQTYLETVQIAWDSETTEYECGEVWSLKMTTLEFDGVANDGYLFLGIGLDGQGPSEKEISSTLFVEKGVEVFIFFKPDSAAKLLYDEEENYFYFEDGEYPQSYVGDELNEALRYQSSVISSVGTMTYNDGQNLQNVLLYVYDVDGDGMVEKYAAVIAPSTKTLVLNGEEVDVVAGCAYFFKVEPIRWRVSDYGVRETDYPEDWAVYGSYTQNFTAVSDKILSVGVITTDDTNEGWSFADSEIAVITSENQANAADRSQSFNYSGTAEISVDKVADAASQNVVTSETKEASGMQVVSLGEITFTDKRARLTDFAAFLLGENGGDYEDYWTRDLAYDLGNGYVMRSYGAERARWLDGFYGVRFSYIFSEGIRC
ncbi:MAG: InlB B-repeat-containing protein [Clostridia bacterium]|nr:InlB B-repeat-containing protein [Clostridia bacterium]